MLPHFIHREVAKLLKKAYARGVIDEYRAVVGAYPPYIQGMSEDEYLAEVERRTEVARGVVGVGQVAL